MTKHAVAICFVWLFLFVGCSTGTSSVAIETTAGLPAVPSTTAVVPTPEVIAAVSTATPTAEPAAVEQPTGTPVVVATPTVPTDYDNRIVINGGYSDSFDKIIEGMSMTTTVSRYRSPNDQPRFILSFEIDVDYRSGEDGYPKPGFSFTAPTAGPISAIAGQDFSQIATFDVGWYGNDAPEITHVRGHFGQWVSPTEIEVGFVATFDGDGQMRFSGITPVGALRVFLADPNDAPVLIEQVFGVGSSSWFNDITDPALDTTPQPGRSFAMQFDWVSGAEEAEPADGVTSIVVIEPSD